MHQRVERALPERRDEVRRSLDVRSHARHRFLPRPSVVRVAGKVEHDLGSELLDEFPERVGVEQVDGEVPSVARRTGTGAAGRQGLSPQLAESRRQVGADEPGGTGDEDAASSDVDERIVGGVHALRTQGAPASARALSSCASL